MVTRTQDLPTGTVTFFFSDVQDSTGLLQRLASEFKDVVERHATIISDCLAARNGVEVSTEGDSFFAGFRQAADAVDAAMGRRVREGAAVPGQASCSSAARADSGT